MNYLRMVKRVILLAGLLTTTAQATASVITFSTLSGDADRGHTEGNFDAAVCS
jgi:hypothetical protein